MSESIYIKDSATLLAALTAIELKKVKADNIKFSGDFDLCVKLYGDQWDGKIDYKAAEYVIKLQKAFLSAYNSASDNPPLRYNRQPMENLRVTVTIREGCEELFASLKDVIMSLPPEYQVGAIIAVAVIGFGAKLVRDWHADKLEAQTKKEAIDAAKAIVNDVADVVEKSIDAHAETIQRVFTSNKEQPHLAYLSSKMKEGDTMQINDGKIYTRGEAQETFAHTAIPIDIEIQSSEYHVDGEYEAVAYDRIADKVAVRIDGKKRQFSLERLSDVARALFWAELARAKTDRRHCPPTQLQLTACFRGGVFEGGYVDGIGDARSDTLAFEEARQLSIAAAEQDYEHSEG